MPFGPMQGGPAAKQVNTAGGPSPGAPMGAPGPQGAPPGAQNGPQGGGNAPQQLDPKAIQGLARALTPDNFKTFMQIFGAVMMDTYSLIQKSGGGQGGPQGAPGGPQGAPPGPQGGIMGANPPPGAGPGTSAQPGPGADQGM